MTPIQSGAAIVDAAMRELLPGKFDSKAARVQLLAIGMQESEWTFRKQVGGPAHGFLQFEVNGVRGVLNNVASRLHIRAACLLRSVAPTSSDCYLAIVQDDQLAIAFGRLLLWCDPHPLPAIGDANAAWDLYLRCWRPGKPRRDVWDANYAAAMAETAGQPTPLSQKVD